MVDGEGVDSAEQSAAGGTQEGGLADMAIRDPKDQKIDEGLVPSLRALPPTGSSDYYPRGGVDVDADDEVRSESCDETRVRRNPLRRQLVADVVGLAVAAVVGPLVVVAMSNDNAHSLSNRGDVFLAGLAMIPVFVGVFALYGLYRGVARRLSNSVFPDLGKIANALMVSGLLYTVIVYLWEKAEPLQGLSVATTVSMCLAGMVFVPLARALSFGPLTNSSDRSVPVIVVGTGKLATTVASHLRAQSGVKFAGFVDDYPMGARDVIGNLDELPELCRAHGVARVVVCFSRTHPERTSEMLRSLAGEVGISIIPRYYDLITSASRVEDLSGLTMLDIAPSSLSARSRYLKRAFDIVASSLILIAVSPILLVMAIAIATTSPGPVFFRQIRTGRGGEPFAILKFRTMYEDAESRRQELAHLNQVDGPLFKMHDDPRVTPVGRLLRRRSLDELAQLFNVWKGDMSLVGPRPFVVAEAEEIKGLAARKRFEVRPGMTGLWQVSGRNELSHLELCRLDYQYVASWSFGWDMEILWNTPKAVIRSRGAS
jgi:exopolysaccharide biosynthesis polyprenyl glycosylphosphotransferase